MFPVRIIALLVLLTAGGAEARFGKSSGGSRSSPSGGGGGRSGGSSFHPSAGYVPPATPYRPRWSWGYGSLGYGPIGYALFPAGPRPAGPDDELTVRVRGTVGVEAMAFSSGANLGIAASFEGEQWGVSFSAADIIAAADDGTKGIDQIGVFTAHLTYALLTGEVGRLRAELGADAFFAPQLTVVGPTMGFSGSAWFTERVGLEGAVMVTPWPFTQIDARAGVAIALGQVGLRAGWRVQFLDDRGLVDGVPHRDVFTGPYLGLALAF